MKILVVSHTPHYLKDGQAFGWGPTVREIDALATIAAELVHVAPMHNEPAPDCALAYRMRNVRLHPVPASGGATLTAKFGVGRALPAYVRAIASELRDADIVHVRCPAHVSMVALVMLEALGRSRRQWIKYAGTWAPDAHSPRSYRFQRWLSTRPRHDRVVTINGRWADQPSHVRSLPNPCLTDEELDTGRRLARDKALAGPVRLLFVGALIPPKGAAMLPGILQAVQRHGVSATIDIVGDGPDRRVIERAVQARRLEGSVRLRGWLSRESLAGLYRDAHLLLLPSRTEGWPKVVSEGMASGVVPIAGRVGSVPQYLEEFGIGVALDPHDCAGYVQAVIDYVRNPSRWAAESARGLEVAPLFSYSVFLDLVKGLLGLTGTRVPGTETSSGDSRPHLVA